jgi:anti-sigma factor RsiW
MSCPLWQDWLDPFLDNGTTPEESAGIQEHIRACPACAAEALTRLRIKHSIRTAAAAQFAPSPVFVSLVRQSIHGSGNSQILLRLLANLRRKLPPLTRQHKQIAIASAAAVLILVVLLTVLSARSARRTEALSELLDLHVTESAASNPVDLATADRNAVIAWFQGKLPFTFHLPEFNNSAYKLLGARLIYYRNSPGAEILFESQKRRLSLFILQTRRGTTPASVGVAKSRQDGFNEETWGQDGLRYAVIADANSTEVHALGEMIRTAGNP